MKKKTKAKKPTKKTLRETLDDLAMSISDKASDLRDERDNQLSLDDQIYEMENAEEKIYELIHALESAGMLD